MWTGKICNRTWKFIKSWSRAKNFNWETFKQLGLIVNKLNIIIHIIYILVFKFFNINIVFNNKKVNA